MASSWSAPNRLDQEPGATQSLLPKMTVERTGRVHRATFKHLRKVKASFWVLDISEWVPFYAREHPRPGPAYPGGELRVLGSQQRPIAPAASSS